jgi:hypothetical protein
MKELKKLVITINVEIIIYEGIFALTNSMELSTTREIPSCLDTR